MEEKNVFNEALLSFTKEFAYAGAVRHLYDSGYTIEMIKDNIDYPVSLEQIQKVIDEYEDKKTNPAKAYEYIEDVDSYGKKSYRRVLIDIDDLKAQDK